MRIKALDKFFKNVSIRMRMVLLCLAVALPLVASGSLFLWKQYDFIQKETLRSTSFKAGIGSRSLSQWIQAQLSSVSAISAIESLSTSLSAHDSSCASISTALALHKDWSEVALLLPDGTPVSVVANAGTSIKSKNAIASAELQSVLKQVAKSKKPLMSSFIYSPWTQKPALSVVAPVMKGQSTELSGFVVANINPESVLDLFAGLQRLEGTVITVVDSNKRVIARTLETKYWQGKDFSQSRCVLASQKAKSGTIETVGIADKIARTYAFDKIEPYDWLLIMGVPSPSVFGHSYHWLHVMILLSALAITASLAMAFLFTKEINRTINALAKAAKAIGEGNFRARVAVTTNDELGSLARSFNSMASTLNSDKEQKMMVQHISRAVRQSLNLTETLNTTVRELGKNLNASRCCLALLEAGALGISDDELYFEHTWWNTEAGGMPLSKLNVPMPKYSLLRTIIEQGEVSSIDLINGQERLRPVLIRGDDWTSVRSLIACPITTEHGPLGIILVQQCDRLRVWSQTELELVEAVAGQVSVAIKHAQLYERSKNMVEQEVLINQIVKSVRSSLDLNVILNTSTKELLRALNVDRVQIIQPRSEEPLVVTHEFTKDGFEPCLDKCIYPENLDFSPNQDKSSISIRNTVLGINLEALLAEGNDGEASSQVDQATTMQELPIAVIHDTAQDSRCIPFKQFIGLVGSKALVAAPLSHENRLLGLLMVHQCSNSREWTQSEVQLVMAIADQLAIAVTHAHLFAQVHHQSITDGLTGLYNHVYFKRRLEEEIRLANRKGTHCSLIMIDLDKLKHINDNFGHPVGDAAIRQIGAILNTSLRSGDTAARYGGEEFGVILPETSLAEAAMIAGRLCNRIRQSHVPGLGQITASLGSSTFPHNASNPAELIETADKALYVAKNGGRNQSKTFDELCKLDPSKYQAKAENTTATPTQEAIAIINDTPGTV